MALTGRGGSESESESGRVSGGKDVGMGEVGGDVMYAVLAGELGAMVVM